MNERSEMSYPDKEIENNKPNGIIFFDPPMHLNPETAQDMIKDSEKSIDLPRGMLSIASNLKEHNIPAKVVPIDAHLHSLSNDPKSKEISKKNELQSDIEQIIDQQISKFNPRVIGISMMYTFTEPIALKMIKYIKSKYPDKKIIVGGNHATFSDDYLLGSDNNGKRFSEIDVLVRNEGEITMEELMKELEQENPDLDKIKGISYVDNQGIIKKTEPRERADLYKLPPLNYDLINSPIGLEDFNNTLMFLRGCYGKCAFCSSPQYWNRKITKGKTENFEHELEYLAKNGVKIVGLLDDDILASNEGFDLLINSIKKIKKQFPDIKFIAQTRVDHLKNQEKCMDKLRKLKEVGVEKLYLGIESGSQEILDEMGKGIKKEWIKPACKNVKNSGIEVGAFWLFGHPGADINKENESLEFMEELLEEHLIDDLELHRVVPFAGTKVNGDERIRKLNEEHSDWSALGYKPIYDLIDPENNEIVLSANQISDLLHKATKLKEKYL